MEEIKTIKYHDIQAIAVAGDILTFRLEGKEYHFELSKVSKRLSSVSEEIKKQFVLSASGYGIHWPMVDEDLSIDGLLGIKHTPQSQISY